MIKLEVRNYFKVGDVVEFFGPNMETFTLTINNIYNEDNEMIDIANHPKMIVYIPSNNEVFKGNMMRLKTIDK